MISEKYEILKILPFTSARKRMSIVLKQIVEQQDQHNNDDVSKVQQSEQIIVYTKGADDVMLPRVSNSISSSIMKECTRLINSFAMEGLRTLCMGMKTLSSDEYMAWSQKNEEANLSINNREVCYIKKD